MTGRRGGLAWRHDDAGVVVHFRLTPKSSKDIIDGLNITSEGATFCARVRALPEDGEANAALVKLVSDWLGVPKRSVELISGGKSRLKSLRISGDIRHLDRQLQAKLEALLS